MLVAGKQMYKKTTIGLHRDDKNLLSESNST